MISEIRLLKVLLLGVVFGLVPTTNPTSTFIFKVLICLKGRNALILNPSRRAVGVSNHIGELVQQVLREQGAPSALVQWLGSNKSRATASTFMEHPGVSFILATGGTEMVKAAYRSGTPTIGVGAGNAPVLVCADKDLLTLDGSGHTAMIYTHKASLTQEFGASMPASRILVNAQ